jgi:hypothetical protein
VRKNGIIPPGRQKSATFLKRCPPRSNIKSIKMEEVLKLRLQARI